MYIKHGIEASITLENLDVTVRGNILPYEYSRYKSNGDPGDPPEGGYCEDVEIIYNFSIRIKMADGTFKSVKREIDITKICEDENLLDDLSIELYENWCKDQE